MNGGGPSIIMGDGTGDCIGDSSKEGDGESNDGGCIGSSGKE